MSRAEKWFGYAAGDESKRPMHRTRIVEGNQDNDEGYLLDCEIEGRLPGWYATKPMAQSAARKHRDRYFGTKP